MTSGPKFLRLKVRRGSKLESIFTSFPISQETKTKIHVNKVTTVVWMTIVSVCVINDVKFMAQLNSTAFFSSVSDQARILRLLFSRLFISIYPQRVAFPHFAAIIHSRTLESLSIVPNCTKHTSYRCDVQGGSA